jgi:4-amino-4-deoxy-L-arabinose transferase-like glycosyltransferase
VIGRARALWLTSGVLILAVAWFVLLGAHPLFNPDEGRYAEIPREMLATGQLLVPRLNGIIYIEKPPLQYWMSVGSFALFGVSEWSARLPAGLAGFLTLLVVFEVARRLWGRAAAWRAALMCGSALLVVLLSHHLTLDMSLTLFMTAALGAFCVAQHSRAQEATHWRWMLIAWIATALGVMTKGLVAVLLPGATLVLYALLQRDSRVWRHLWLTRGLAVLIVIAAPWFLWMQWSVPQFFDFFFIREHFARYLTRISDRHEPWWFFAPVLLVGVLPWLPSALRALASNWRASAPRGEFDARRFLWCWVVVTFGFFSASDSKLVPYILPLFPALVLLMAAGDEQNLVRELRLTARLAIAFAFGLAGLAVIEPYLVQSFGWNEATLTLRPGLIAMAALLAVGGITSLVVRVRPTAALAAIAVAAFAATGVLLECARGLTPLYSAATLVNTLPRELRSVPAYAVRHYDQTLPFYLGHTTTLVEERNELDFGLCLEPWRETGRLSEFERQWGALGQGLAIVTDKDLSELERRGVPMRIRARNAEAVLISRR